MNFHFGDKEQKIRDAAFDAGKTLPAASFAERWKYSTAAGLTGINIPAEYGGAGCNAMETALALEGFGEGCADGGFTFSLGAHLLAGVIPLVNHAPEKIKKNILQKISSGEFILANAMTETGSGSHAFAMKTTAKPDGEFYVLNGVKTFCTNAPVADGILVYAVTDEVKGFFGGISCFLLEKKKHAFKTGPLLKKTALHNSPMAEVFLDDVRIEKENMIGSPGGGAMIFLESMNHERACMSAMHAGIMTRLCSMTRAYITSRVTAEKKLSDHQGVQFRLAEMFLQTENAKLLAYRAAKMIDEKKDATFAAAQAKIFSSEALCNITREAILLHGANGIMDEYGLTEILADAQSSMIYSGANDVLRGLIASRL